MFHILFFKNVDGDHNKNNFIGVVEAEIRSRQDWMKGEHLETGVYNSLKKRVFKGGRNLNVFKCYRKKVGVEKLKMSERKEAQCLRWHPQLKLRNRLRKEIDRCSEERPSWDGGCLGRSEDSRTGRVCPPA